MIYFPVELLKRKNKAEIDKDDPNLAIACNDLGNYYQLDGQYEKALQEYKQEAAICSRTKNKLKFAIANRMIGEVHFAMEQFEEALRSTETYLRKFPI